MIKNNLKKHKNYDKLKISGLNNDDENYILYYFPNGNNLRVILFGTSMIEGLSKTIPLSFKNVKKIRCNLIKNIPNEDTFKIFKCFTHEIFDYKPDIIIISISYMNLDQLINLNETD